jgi:hypothetical protein
MEPKTGFEPVTFSLPRKRSTPELLGLNLQIKIQKNFGAGDEARTRDPQLGRLMLYQLSYSRPLDLGYRISDFGFFISIRILQSQIPNQNNWCMG